MANSISDNAILAWEFPVSLVVKAMDHQSGDGGFDSGPFRIAPLDIPEEVCIGAIMPLSVAPSLSSSHIGAVFLCLVLPTTLAFSIDEGHGCSHVISIQLTGTDGRDEFLCGGALITDRDVLTLAECVHSGDAVRDAIEIRVIYGSWVDANKHRSTVHNVAAVWPHPQYVPSMEINNLAVLRLSESIHFTNRLGSLQLATDPVKNFTCTLCGLNSNISSGRQPTSPPPVNLKLSQMEMTYCSDTKPDNALQQKALICSGIVAEHGKLHFSGKGSLLVCEAQLCGLSTMAGGNGWFSGAVLFVDVVPHRDWIIDRAQAEVMGGTVPDDKGPSQFSNNWSHINLEPDELQLLTDPLSESDHRRGSNYPHGNDPDVTWKEINNDNTIWLVIAPITILIFIVLILLYRSFSGRQPKYCNII
ncbi:hypothetical protein RP20_CCG022324 [Aedes albopictus]|nr:hypothetical protein RP20_CCG022324 [Aedes albopictus]